MLPDQRKTDWRQLHQQCPPEEPAVSERLPHSPPVSATRTGLRVAGIPLRLTAPAIVVLGLLALSLATGLLPDAAPGMSVSSYWAAGLVGAAGAFAALLLRELAQILVRRRSGLDVGSAVLSPFGAAQAGPPAPTPRLEAKVALSGMAANLSAAAVLGGVGALLQVTGIAPLLAAVALYVAGLNALLAAVHALPGLPLDGGRLLRAWRWSRTGDRSAATSLAARAGRLIGLVVVGAGLVLVLSGSLTGLWALILGAFVMAAARQELRVTQVHDALAGLTVRDALSAVGRLPQPQSESLAESHAQENSTVGLAAWMTVDALLQDHPQLAGLDDVLPLRGFDGSPAGLVPLAAIAAVPAERRAEIRLRDIAVPADSLPVARLDDQLVDVLLRPLPVGHGAVKPGLIMLAGHILVVAEHGSERLVGVLAPADLARATTVAGLVRSQPGSAVPSTKDAPIAA